MTDNSTEIGDVQLIHAWINGDARAFDMLYDRYKQPLYGYLHNLFRGENANIDDIFQRTWLKVIEHLPKYQDQEKFSAWLMRIAGNLAIDFFRSRKRRRRCCHTRCNPSAHQTAKTAARPWSGLRRRYR